MRVDAIDLSHQARQVGLVSLHDKMAMIAHQTVGEGGGLKAFKTVLENPQPRSPVGIIVENRLAAITARSHMVERAFKLQPQRTRLDQRLLSIWAKGKT